eukprot:1200030-Alexandrium_andersonii.AAC.1
MVSGTHLPARSASMFSHNSVSHRPRWMLHATLLNGWPIGMPLYEAAQVPKAAYLHAHMASRPSVRSLKSNDQALLLGFAMLPPSKVIRLAVSDTPQHRSDHQHWLCQ